MAVEKRILVFESNLKCRQVSSSRDWDRSNVVFGKDQQVRVYFP